MINELKAMAIFAEVVKQGSFRKAANVVGLSPSVVSYHVAQLEAKVGSALLYRSTRSLTLSHDGESFYQQVLKMLDAANGAISMLSHNQDEPTGKLKISLPTALSRSDTNKRIADFALTYPKIELDIEYSDTRKNIIDEGVDLTIRAGELADSELKSTKIGAIERVLVCSPKFYKKQAVPEHPEDLITWPWLKLAQLPNKRTFLFDGMPLSISFDSTVTVNSVEAIYQFCLSGLGLAVLSKSQVASNLADKTLLHVIPDWEVEALPLSAIWTKNTADNSNTKLLLSFLKDG
ncbi:LysR family transcriptional regulator [Thalassotalea euphylliae]|uniref:LysR family transcriptional regulator n=1 Tax=Thalassotalea euphylliae TaxID=1655234 RepID=UPI003637AF60